MRFDMRKWLLMKMVLCLFSICGGCGSAFAENSLKFNIPTGVTPISHQIYTLHMLIFYVCVVIGIIVFSVLVYSLIEHRKSKGAKPADFHSSLSIEILWAVIPFIILVIMAIPATQVLIRMDDTAHSQINIKVTGYQWKWQYEYLDYGIKFFSNLSTPLEQREGQVAKNPWYLLEVDHLQTMLFIHGGCRRWASSAMLFRALFMKRGPQSIPPVFIADNVLNYAA
jgi:cytochrome c oxidase subunit 2